MITTGTPISIHLMFLLIILYTVFWFYIMDFNTSHVSINQVLKLLFLVVFKYFNTSHVSINHYATDVYDTLRHISIHLMFLLI